MDIHWVLYTLMRYDGIKQRGDVKMAVEIIKTRIVEFPALRFIGKRCLCDPGPGFVAKWNEWLENGWFSQLEKLNPAPENGNAYLGAGPGDVYWIGLLFPAETSVPNGFEYADIPADKYIVFEIGGKKDGELLNEDGAKLCFNEIQKNGWILRNGGWCYERYSRPDTIVSIYNEKNLFECVMAIE